MEKIDEAQRQYIIETLAKRYNEIKEYTEAETISPSSVVDQWARYGLLDGLRGSDKTRLAVALDAMAKFLLNDFEGKITSSLEGAIFPFLRKCLPVLDERTIGLIFLYLVEELPMVISRLSQITAPIDYEQESMQILSEELIRKYSSMFLDSDVTLGFACFSNELNARFLIKHSIPEETYKEKVEFVFLDTDPDNHVLLIGYYEALQRKDYPKIEQIQVRIVASDGVHEEYWALQDCWVESVRFANRAMVENNTATLVVLPNSMIRLS